jgi:putative Mn2+ efflux pump MntP
MKNVNASSSPPRQASLQLALPMTLNNLTGGVAGGLLGVSPLVGTFWALVASVISMNVGYWLGKRSLFHRASTAVSTITGNLSIGLYAAIAALKVHESFCQSHCIG